MQNINQPGQRIVLIDIYDNHDEIYHAQLAMLNSDFKIFPLNVYINKKTVMHLQQLTVADLHSKILDARPPLEVQILSISCSFWENLAKSYVGAPPWRVGAPSSGKSWIRHWLNVAMMKMLLGKQTRNKHHHHMQSGIVMKCVINLLALTGNAGVIELHALYSQRRLMHERSTENALLGTSHVGSMRVSHENQEIDKFDNWQPDYRHIGINMMKNY